MRTLSTGIASALWSLRDEGATYVPPTETVPYAAPRRGIAPLADVYLPERPTGASVVLVHGGALVIGSRRMKPIRRIASRLVDAGIAVYAVDYRLVFRGGRLDEALQDVLVAAADWRRRARGPLSLVGLSAGATLSLLAARTVAADRLALCFGLYDEAHYTGLAAIYPRAIGGRGLAERCRAAQPDIPTLVLHGTADRLVPVEQSLALAAHREELGYATRLVTYPDAPHGFFNTESPTADAALAELVAFVA